MFSLRPPRNGLWGSGCDHTVAVLGDRAFEILLYRSDTIGAPYSENAKETPRKTATAPGETADHASRRARRTTGTRSW